jgi:hypothetical protein
MASRLQAVFKTDFGGGADRVRTALLIAWAITLGGCATVEPWDRGNLAKPQMAAEPHPAQRDALDHVYRSREGTSRGASAQGGGCGCY